MKGIYQIKSISSGKIYIGKSVELETRWRKHLTLLRRNKHYNLHLQRCFNKYGETDFSYEILEIVPEFLSKSEVSHREIFWIASKRAYGNGNFNQTAGGEWGATAKRKVKLKNINTGEIREFESLAEAGRQLGISPSDIYKMLENKKVKRLKEWTNPKNRYSSKAINQKEFILYHDQFPAYAGHNRTEFARKIGVAHQVIDNLLKGKFKNCKGWRTTKQKTP